MTTAEVVIEDEEDLIPCHDTECSGQAEIEADGTVQYRVCQACGFEFDYVRIEVSSDQEVCQLGVPEDLRRAASGPMEEAMRPKTIPLTVIRKE